MLQSGQVINGTYLVDRRLGFGGMAEVFLVTHARIPRQFALKLLRVEIGERQNFLDRFRREAEILATVRSAHIVDVMDWDYTYDGQPFIAMEYLEGETLAAFLHRSGALPVETALDIFAQIGEGLCAAHAVGVIHRDLKPNNIFLDRNGGRPNFVKILDFGIAKLTEDTRTPLTAHASVMGTPGYMAPEQAVGRLEGIDQRADQFALAVILYEMLSGRPAFYTPGEALYRTLERLVNEDPVPLGDSPLARVVGRALAKQPEWRYASVRELMDAVAQAALQGQYPPQTLALPTRPELEVPTGEQRGRLWLPIVGSALLVIAAVAWRLLNPAGATLQRGSGQRAGAPVGVPGGSADRSTGGQILPARDTAAELKPRVGEALVGGPAGSPAIVASPVPRPAEPSTGAGTGATPGAIEPASPSRRTSSSAAPYRTFVISGVDAAQEKVLRICAEKELRTLPGLPGGVIELERSGALQVVQGPLVVHRSGLTGCLRQAFAATGSEPPRAATIRVLVSRR